MKKYLFRLLYHLGRLTGWRWLMITSGLIVIAACQTSRVSNASCYDYSMPPDTIKEERPLCYKAVVPVDTSGKNKSTEDFIIHEIKLK